MGQAHADRSRATQPHRARKTRKIHRATGSLHKQSRTAVDERVAENAYARERQRITDGRAPERDDRLAKISVFIDADGVMRLRGRIAAADAIQKEMVNPAVYIEHIIIRSCTSRIYMKNCTTRDEIVVNELRQRVYIAKIRPAVKEVIARCAAAYCAKRDRPPPLPATYRCAPRLWSPPYIWRVVVSLSTDSAINALRRFIARRGCPTELWSDNATAFRGAARELSEAVKNEAEARRINWRFLRLPPPFMAGAWERMVRGVKEALKATLHENTRATRSYTPCCWKPKRPSTLAR
ncbi:uncharacterized protein [Choristoneura fumiferana]|uniref:uncharacterized protein n=1 Tax=Choristoneura fumiferana TaxID=7141 RepID=UPI003D15E44F